MAWLAWPAATGGPNFGEMLEQAPLLLTSKFGDGYEQQVGYGMNASDVTSFSLVHGPMYQAEKDAAETFLAARAGVEPFTYTVPESGEVLTFICPQWQFTLQKGSDVWKLEMKLERRFDVS
jgi:phage-related protein